MTKDQRLARAAIEAGRAWESLWGAGASPDARLEASAEAQSMAGHFARAVASSADADDEDLKRLATFTPSILPSCTLRQVMAFLVPFERWAERPLRDDEFLVQEGDSRTPNSTPVTGPPLAAVLDNLRSAFNVGALFRAAECAGAQRVELSGYTPSPATSAAGKTAMGADTLLTWTAHARLKDAAQALHADGYALVALETSDRAVDVYDLKWPEKTAILVGNERFGLGADALRAADLVCRIPMFGRKNSLNVAAAFAVAAFERQRAWRSS